MCHKSHNTWWILPQIDPELHFMIIYLCIKFESNTLHGPDRMDSGDFICRPNENGMGGWGGGGGGWR